MFLFSKIIIQSSQPQMSAHLQLYRFFTNRLFLYLENEIQSINQPQTQNRSKFYISDRLSKHPTFSELKRPVQTKPRGYCRGVMCLCHSLQKLWKTFFLFSTFTKQRVNKMSTQKYTILMIILLFKIKICNIPKTQLWLSVCSR